MGRVIAVITDFGYGVYVGQMKGVILGINPNAVIIDLAHDIGRQNVREGAFVLYHSYKYFPKETVFLCVVDPGVGGHRRAIAIETKNYFLVGPDNGLMYPVAEDDGFRRVVELSNPRYMLPAVSRTFHGRDIFAPAAAYLSLGLEINELGCEIDPRDLVRLRFPKPRSSDRYIDGEVLYVDRFGNIITNIPDKLLYGIGVKLGDILSIEVAGRLLEIPFVKNYSSVEEGVTLCLIDSFNLLEISVNKGNASKMLNVKEGDSVRIFKNT